VELLIGLAIVGVLVAVALPNILGQMPKYRLNGAARQVLGELMAARMQAVSQNATVKVFFRDNRRYTICRVPTSASTVENCIGTVRTKDIQNEYFGVTLQANNDPVFFSRGTATNMATIEVTNASGARRITVSIAGRVKIN